MDIDLPAQSKALYEQALGSLFGLFEELCEGTIAVDREARVVWINDKYRSLLGLGESEPVVGRPVEEVIPHSLMRQVVETGHPILLDLMKFQERWFVVTRIPLKDEGGAVVGAVGFVLYDKLDYLKPLVSRFAQLQNELAAARQALSARRGTRYTLSQFIGSSPAILEVKRLARRAAQLDTTVMLLGETGTGKELLAQGIHAASARAHRPFVGVNMAAVPETLLEAEFFGAAPGAFTGADRKGREGKFKAADGGTLFLDEIGEMPMPVQAKLLRALQEQEIEPLGADRVVKVDVRVIAATGRDLKTLVEQGQFRSDLYYRLNVLPIALPPLRERTADLEALCDLLLEGVATATGQPQRDIHPGAMALLRAYDWPGNVRELRNVLERACVLSEGRVVTREDVARILPPLSGRPRGAQTPAELRPLAEMVAEVERAAIEAALAASRGKKAPAAKLLGISRSNLYEKLSDLGILSEERT